MAGMMVAAGPQLTDMQARFVEAVLAGSSGKEAAELAGYSEATNLAALWGSPSVQAALDIGCRARMKGELRAKALKALDDMLTLTTTPAATRFQAAKLVIEQTDAQPGEADKPLTSMTEAELQAFVDKAQKALEGRLIDVTPGNGAQPTA